MTMSDANTHEVLWREEGGLIENAKTDEIEGLNRYIMGYVIHIYMGHLLYVFFISACSCSYSSL